MSVRAVGINLEKMVRGDERERELSPRTPGEAVSLRAEGDRVGVWGPNRDVMLLLDSVLVLIQVQNKHVFPVVLRILWTSCVRLLSGSWRLCTRVCN